MSSKKRTIIRMMKNFIRFGCGLKSFKEFSYPICKHFTALEIDELWGKAFNEMSK